MPKYIATYIVANLHEYTLHSSVNADYYCEGYRKQQKLSSKILSRFLQIFDELQKISLLTDRLCDIDIIMEAKSQRFSQHFLKSYQAAKVFSRLTFVVYSNYNHVTMHY